jgi:hypothetical protein
MPQRDWSNDYTRVHTRRLDSWSSGIPFSRAVVQQRQQERRMATYKVDKYVTQNNSTAFDHDYQPGQQPPHSGIYKCMGCGHEIVAEEARSFPPQNHHQHTQQQGRIRWRLIVYAEHDSKVI